MVTFVNYYFWETCRSHLLAIYNAGMRSTAEIVRRIKDGGLNASAVAREAGLTKQYLSKITTGVVKTVQDETGDRIMAAIDKLASAAAGGSVRAPKVVHPGVEAIASNAQLVEECDFTEENITAARSLFWLEADGRPHIIKTISEAMDYLRLMQRS